MARRSLSRFVLAWVLSPREKKNERKTSRRSDPAAVHGLLGIIDPTMVVHRAQTLAEGDRAGLTLAGLYGLAVGFFVFAALLLSTTGVYAMMSFTATQRTREIGYLGADGPFALSGGLFAEGPGAIIGAAFLIVSMGLIACGRPMRRALSVPPTVALRSDD